MDHAVENHVLKAIDYDLNPGILRYNPNRGQLRFRHLNNVLTHSRKYSKDSASFHFVFLNVPFVWPSVINCMLDKKKSISVLLHVKKLKIKILHIIGPSQKKFTLEVVNQPFGFRYF